MAVTIGSLGGTETILGTPSTTTLATKGITAGTGISLGSTSSAVTVTNSDPASGVTLTNSGSGNTLVDDGTGPSLSIKSVTAGSGITITTSSTDVTINQEPPACIVRKSTNTTCTPGNTIITFDVEDFDNANMHSTVTNPSRITVPTTGLYLVNGGAAFNAIGTAGNVGIFIQRTTTGPTTTQLVYQFQYTASTAANANVSRLVQLTAGDYVELGAVNGLVGNITLATASPWSPVLSVVKVGQ